MTTTPPITKVNVWFLHSDLHFLRKERNGDMGSYLKEIQQNIDIPLVLIEGDLVRRDQEHDVLEQEVQRSQ